MKFVILFGVLALIFIGVKVTPRAYIDSFKQAIKDNLIPLALAAALALGALHFHL